MLELGAGYTYLHANAPPGTVRMLFGEWRLRLAAAFNMPRDFSLVADLAAAHAGNLGGTTQAITVFNFLFGPRYSLRGVSKRLCRMYRRWAAARRRCLVMLRCRTGWVRAFSVGGGVSTTLRPHFGWTIVEAESVGARAE